MIGINRARLAVNQSEREGGQMHVAEQIKHELTDSSDSDLYDSKPEQHSPLENNRAFSM